MAFKNVYVYILRLPNGRFYTGITQDIDKRIQQHNSGKSKFTSHFLPVTLLWSQVYADRFQARAIEVHIKNKGAKRFLEHKGFAIELNHLVKLF